MFRRFNPNEPRKTLAALHAEHEADSCDAASPDGRWLCTRRRHVVDPAAAPHQAGLTDPAGQLLVDVAAEWDDNRGTDHVTDN